MTFSSTMSCLFFPLSASLHVSASVGLCLHSSWSQVVFLHLPVSSSLSPPCLSVCSPSTQPGARVKGSPLTRSLFPPSAGPREPEVHRSGVRLHQQRGEMQHSLHRPLRLCHKLQNCPVSARPPPSPLPPAGPGVRTAQGACAPPRVTFLAKHGSAGGAPSMPTPR